LSFFDPLKPFLPQFFKMLLHLVQTANDPATRASKSLNLSEPVHLIDIKAFKYWQEEKGQSLVEEQGNILWR